MKTLMHQIISSNILMDKFKKRMNEWSGSIHLMDEVSWPCDTSALC